MQVFSLLAIVFALLVAIFAIQNAVVVEINFLAWKFPQMSLVLVIFGSAAFGAFFVFLLGLFKQLRLIKEVRELRGQNKNMSEKIEQLEQMLTEKDGRQDGKEEHRGEEERTPEV